MHKIWQLIIFIPLQKVLMKLSFMKNLIDTVIKNILNAALKRFRIKEKLKINYKSWNFHNSNKVFQSFLEGN